MKEALYDVYISINDQTLRLLVTSGNELPATFGQPWSLVETLEEKRVSVIDRENIRKAGYTLYRTEWANHAA